MKTNPTLLQELNDFALKLNKIGWQIIVPKEPSSYFKCFKEGIFIYIQYERFGGPFSFSTINKPSKEDGTGARAIEGDLNIANLQRACIFFTQYNGYNKSQPLKKYIDLEDYFKSDINNILGNYIYKF